MSVIESLSVLASRHLSRKRLLSLRDTYHGLRVKLYPVYVKLFGTFSAEDMKRELLRKLPQHFEILMVHTSYNHMLPMYVGNAVDLLRMLVGLCGPERTLVMPAFYFGDRRLNDVVKFYRDHPIFDVRRTPSRMGLISELFRRYKGVKQSLHPSHRIAALGPLADELTTGHH